MKHQRFDHYSNINCQPDKHRSYAGNNDEKNVPLWKKLKSKPSLVGKQLNNVRSFEEFKDATDGKWAEELFKNSQIITTNPVHSNSNGTLWPQTTTPKWRWASPRCSGKLLDNDFLQQQSFSIIRRTASNNSYRSLCMVKTARGKLSAEFLIYLLQHCYETKIWSSRCSN